MTGNDITWAHIVQSNLIEGVEDPEEHNQSFKAWEWYKQVDADKAFTFENILELHRLIMLRAWPEIAGKLRVTNVQVGERVCPAAYRVPELFSLFIRYMTDAYYKLLPRRMHVEFEHIHPFRDGNGRTGRMIMWKHEILVDYPPTKIDFDNRWDYYEWFK